LPFKGTPRIVATFDDMSLFVFYGDLMWCEDGTLVLSDKMGGQTLLVKRKFDSNIFNTSEVVPWHAKAHL
jgi:hypothetical protein